MGYPGMFYISGVALIDVLDCHGLFWDVPDSHVALSDVLDCHKLFGQAVVRVGRTCHSNSCDIIVKTPKLVTIIKT